MDFQKFDSTATALEEVTARKVIRHPANAANLLDSMKDEEEISLAVADPKLGTIALLPCFFFFCCLMLMFYP
jgi:nucleolar protein 58